MRLLWWLVGFTIINQACRFAYLAASTQPRFALSLWALAAKPHRPALEQKSLVYWGLAASNLATYQA